MTRLLLVGLAVGLCAVRGEGQGVGQTIQGNWVVSVIEKDGQAQPVPTGTTVSVTKDKFTMKEAGKAVFDFAYKLDTSKTPIWMDLTVENVKVQGICELKDDTLRICLGDLNKARASSFATKGKPENDVLLILKRMK